MYYFYSIHHKRSKVVKLGITKYNLRDPDVLKRFKGNPKYYSKWSKHLAIYGSSMNFLEVKVMHESHDLNVIKQWRDYYYDCWNVLDNPKFIHYKKNRKNDKLAGANNPMFGRSIVTEKSLKWYNDGYSKNIFVTENTQPKGYRLGRIIRYKKPHTQSAKDKVSDAQSRAVLDPMGHRYKSIRSAAKACGISAAAMSGRIKRGLQGWRYA